MFITFDLWFDVEWFALGLDSISEVHSVCSTHICLKAVFTIMLGWFVLQKQQTDKQTKPWKNITQ